eukprot:Partr_v1_DN24864_c1_g1_i1_m29613 putative SYS1 Golgi-localized integral membrane protein homolog (S. cerevisiae)
MPTSTSIALGRHSTWDPRLIVAQMVCLQSVFYAAFSISLALLEFVTVQWWPPALVHLLSPSASVDLSSGRGWLVLVALLCAAVACAWSMVWVVGRARSCVDFSCTVLFWHSVVVSVGSASLPSGQWWLASIAAGVVMALLSEYWCLRREMEPIMLSHGSSGRGLGGGDGGDEEIALVATSSSSTSRVPLQQQQ